MFRPCLLRALLAAALAGPAAAQTAPSPTRAQEYQDVRGRYLSEGQFEEMTPALPPGPRRAAKGKNAAYDESTDTYDTIEWLLKHVPGHNGRVGIVGISYPGFYAAASLPNAHPARRGLFSAR